MISSVVPPEVVLARRVVERRRLVPPIDIVDIVKCYATVELIRIPFDLDGISMHLKTKGKRPHIVVNSSMSESRIRFTLAHELGHVLIPWHVGSIADEIDSYEGGLDEYKFYEGEANRFAAELLMPMDWVVDLLTLFANPRDAMVEISKRAKVSPQAAALRVVACNTEQCIFVMLGSGRVTLSGRSEKTHANQPRVGERVNPKTLFPWTKNHWQYIDGDKTYHWWKFTGAVPRSSGACAEWREILQQILDDLSISEDKKQHFKQSVNGVIANANGRFRSERSLEKLYEACLQRMYSVARENDNYREFINHNRFEEFLNARVQALLAN